MQQAGNFKIHIHAFEKLLEQVDVAAVSQEAYCRKYLAHLLLHKKYYLHIYADVLNRLMACSTKQHTALTLVDFGCGNGLLGIFAKYCGFNKVLLIDVDAKFIAASKSLAAQLDIRPDEYLAGSMAVLQDYGKHEIPDAIVGTDVIEHVYDLKEFINGLQKMNPQMLSVFTTASNPENYFKVRALKKIQWKDEWEGGEPGHHDLFGEAPLKPFYTIRKSIIKNHESSFSEKEIDLLAKATRGMIHADIMQAVKKYKTENILPLPADGTNTCNPINGSWTERILSLQTYVSLYEDAGFTCTFYAGFYNEYENGPAMYVKKLLNTAIRIIGKKISPYIVIVGCKN